MRGMEMAESGSGIEPVSIHSNSSSKEGDEVIREEGVVWMDGTVDSLSNARDLSE